MKFGKLKVEIISKNGMAETYKNVSRIVPRQIGDHNQDMILIQQDLSDTEMIERGMNPDEDENWLNIEIDMKVVKEFRVTTMESEII